MRVVEFALLGSCVLFAGFVAYFTSANEPISTEGVPSEVRWAAAAFALCALPISYWLRRSVEAKLRGTTSLPSDEIRARSRVTGMAALEGAILANLVMWLASGDQWPNAVAAVIPFAAGLAQALAPQSDES